MASAEHRPKRYAGDRIRTCEGTKPEDFPGRNRLRTLKSPAFDRLRYPCGLMDIAGQTLKNG